MRNRRTERGYRLRVYLDALRDAKNTSDAQWVENWISGSPNSPFLPRMAWIGYLEQCIIAESSNYFGPEQAAA